MTDKQRSQIAAYLPHRRDPKLPPMEYYVKNQSGQIRRGWITDIFPGDDNDGNWYRVVNRNGAIRSWHDSRYTGGCFHMSELYDNKEDCQDETHLWIDGWEELRRLQEEEENAVF